MTLLLERVRRALAPGFLVDRVLGAGGMGVVFAGRDAALDREVAIKVLRPEQATAVAAERFLREARLLARVRHPNVVPVHQAGEADGLFYFTMDRVPGPSLAERLRSGPLPAADAMVVGRDLLAALGAIHQHQIVHRDLKPANIFFAGSRAVVADFGIARTSGEDGAEPLTRPGSSPGTPDYMAPEQVRGEPATARTDIYSAGMVIYECFTGRRWPALADPAAADWSGVPSRAATALRSALALSPAERWPDAASFAKALAPVPAWQRALTIGLAAAALAAGWWLMREPPASGIWDPGAAVPAAGPGRRLWQDGEALYRAGQWREADSVYGRAVAVDSSCLACRFRRVELDRWLEEDRDTADVRILSESIGRFPPAWQGLIRSLTARPLDRLPLLDSVATGYREFPLAWYLLGEEIFNRGPLFGVPRVEAIEALSQALRIDSGFAAPRMDLALALIAEGDPAASAAVASLNSLPRAEGLAGAQRLLARIAAAYRFGGVAAGEAVWAELTREPGPLDIPQAAAGPRVLSGLGTPVGALDLGRRYAGLEGRRSLQRSGHYAQMFALVALGRPTAADSAASHFLEHSPGVQHTAFRAQLAAAATVLDPGSAQSEWLPAADRLVPMLASPVPALRREAAWLWGLSALRRGDTTGAKQAIARHLQDEPAPRRRARMLEAALAAAGGDPGSALGLTDSLTTDLETWDAAERSPFLRPALQLLRAGWHVALGQRERARVELLWHQHFHLPDYPVKDVPEPAEGDWAFSTLGAWQLARLLDRRDETVCAAYRMVAERWDGGEPGFRARADTARARLSQLECGR